MKNISTIWFAAVALVLLCLMPSCSSSGFKVSAKLKGLGQQSVKVAYCNSTGGLTEGWVAANDNTLLITGDCTSPSLLMVYNSMGVPLLRLLVSSGDDIDIEGSVTEPYDLKVRGSSVQERWSDFARKHKGDYASSSSARLNAAIERYVKENPKDLVSTLLVLVDYAPSDDGNAVARLLERIDKEARPESLLESYNVMNARVGKTDSSFTGLNLLEMRGGDFEWVNLRGGKPSVILFWDKELDSHARNAAFNELKGIDTARVQVIDINIDGDSTLWHNMVDSTGTSWHHYWVPGSIMNSEIVRLNIRATPTLVVTDSLGKQQYRGNDPIKARMAAEKVCGP